MLYTCFCLTQNNDKRDCVEALDRIQMAQSEDFRMNRELERACRPAIAKHCSELVEEDIDHGNVIQCLVQHRTDTDMNEKCRTYVDHFELVRVLLSVLQRLLHIARTAACHARL